MMQGGVVLASVRPATARASEPAALEVRNVTKTYGAGPNAYQALRGVDLTVREGEFVMLCGPSGSGKTTLLSILGCVLQATSGTVRLFGNDVSRRTESELPDLRLGYVGFIFQGHNLLASLSAEENIELVLELRGVARRAARAHAKDLLNRVGLGDKAERLPRELSAGQRQRVAIARALAGRPPLILADEPTASLDAENGALITATLRDLAKKEGHTVLVVTHDSRIVHLADRVIRIEDGLIEEKSS
jgi:putative ABC transport system ATP-binding protein